MKNMNKIRITKTCFIDIKSTCNVLNSTPKNPIKKTDNCLHLTTPTIHCNLQENSMNNRGMNTDVIIPSKAIEALERGELIEAIKLTRESESVGLKEAKIAVERYLDSNPSLKERFKSKASSGGVITVIVLMVVAVVVYLLFSGKLS
jgi:hypothetical protein